MAAVEISGLTKAHISAGTCLTCLAGSFFIDKVTPVLFVLVPVFQIVSYIIGAIAGILAIVTYLRNLKNK